MAHLLIFELPGGDDADIIRAAISRGDSFTFLSGQRAHYRHQPEVEDLLAYAREEIEVSPFHYEEVERRVLELHARHRIDALLCLIDIRLPEASRLAAKLGVRHLNPASARLMRDKFLVRNRLAESGVAQPEFALATSNEGLRTAVTTMALPVLIKPVDGYGSQNIVLLRYDEDLDPLLSPLEDLLPCNADYGLGVTSNDRMLVERYMTGTMVGCDTLTFAGKHTLLGVHEKEFFQPPSFAIRGGCFMPNNGQFGEIETYLISVLDAVEFDWGAAHVELMLTKEGPRLIEINPRLVGAKIPRLVGFALNRSLHADLIALHTGELQAAPATSSTMVSVTRWLASNYSGFLDHVEFPIWNDARIRSVELSKQSGDPVRPPLENADRIGYVMVSGPTRLDAERLADDFLSRCHCRLKE